MYLLQAIRPLVEFVRNLVEHGDAREGKWRGNWRMEWVDSTLMPPPNMVYAALLKLMCAPRLPAVEWTDAPTDLNGLVRFGERRNMFSARVSRGSARAIVLDEMWWPHCLFSVTRRHFTWATKSITRKLELLALSPRQVTQHKWNYQIEGVLCTVPSFTHIHHLMGALQLFYASSSSSNKRVRLLTFVWRQENVWIKHWHGCAWKVNRRARCLMLAAL